mgnify:CR=1 FL=1
MNTNMYGMNTSVFKKVDLESKLPSKVDFIKEVRKATGLGIRDSKDIADYAEMIVKTKTSRIVSS